MILLAAIIVFRMRKPLPAAHSGTPAKAGDGGAGDSRVLPETNAGKLARLEEQQRLETEEWSALQHDVQEAEALLAAHDARFRRYREIWDLFRGWYLQREAKGGNEFTAHPGMVPRKQLLWLEEYQALLKNGETGPMVRRYLDYRDRRYQEGGSGYRERMDINSRQSWTTGGVGLVTPVLPREIERQFLLDPDAMIQSLLQTPDDPGVPSLILTPDQEAYVRDALRAQIMSASARQAMDDLLPPEIQDKQKRAQAIALGTPEISGQIVRLREELNIKKQP